MLPAAVRQTGQGFFTGIFPCRASDRNPHAIGQTKTESAEHAGPFGRTAIFDYSCSRMARRVHGSYRSFRAMTTTGLFPADVRASGNDGRGRSPRPDNINDRTYGKRQGRTKMEGAPKRVPVPTPMADGATRADRPARRRRDSRILRVGIPRLGQYDRPHMHGRIRFRASVPAGARPDLLRAVRRRARSSRRDARGGGPPGTAGGDRIRRRTMERADGRVGQSVDADKPDALFRSDGRRADFGTAPRIDGGPDSPSADAGTSARPAARRQDQASASRRAPVALLRRESPAVKAGQRHRFRHADDRDGRHDDRYRPARNGRLAATGISAKPVLHTDKPSGKEY